MDQSRDDTPGTDKLPDPRGAQDESPGPQEQAPCGVCASLRGFLVEFDPSLKAVDFDPAGTAIGRLASQKDYIESFMVELQEQRGWREMAEQSNRDVDACLREVFPGLEEHYGMPVDGVRQAVEYVRTQGFQKDVRDERIGAIQSILADKIADSAKVVRIQQLLE